MPSYAVTFTLRTVVDATNYDNALTLINELPLPDWVDSQEVEIEEDDMVDCKFCHLQVPVSTAHWHNGNWVGDECCWDERLRSTE